MTVDFAAHEDLLRLAWRSTPAATAAYLTRDEPAAARFKWARHVDFISHRIARAVNGHGPRFICLSEPPQHGKSTLVSKWTPVWFLENWPRLRCILGGYSSEFAEQWGRRARDTIEQRQADLSVRINPRTTAAGEWETALGGGMVATGVGGSITGRSGDGLIIVDDPFKDSVEANSATIRERVWEWFTDVMLTRRGRNTVFVVIHTRWHPDDLIGRIQRRAAEGDPDFPRWDFINLPAIAEAGDPLGRPPGEALWPEEKPLSLLRAQRSMQGSYKFNALYQGRPSAPEGGYFKRKWLEAAIVDRSQLPPRASMRLVRYWDLAGTIEGEKGNADPDWTVGGLMGMCEGVMFVLEWQRFRRSPAQVELAVKQTARSDGPGVKVRMQQDPGQAGKAQVHHYARNVLAGYDFRGITSNVDKVSRSGPVNAAYERGDVKIVRGPWNDDYVEELTTFPNGSHDDQVDVTSGGWQELAEGGDTWDAESVRKAFGPAPADSGRPMTVAEMLARHRSATVSAN